VEKIASKTAKIEADIKDLTKELNSLCPKAAAERISGYLTTITGTWKGSETSNPEFALLQLRDSLKDVTHELRDLSKTSKDSLLAPLTGKRGSVEVEMKRMDGFFVNLAKVTRSETVRSLAMLVD